MKIIKKIPKGKKAIFRPWKTVKGKRIYASSYGLKSFVFYIDK